MDATASERGAAPHDDTWARVDAFLRSRLRPELYDRWFAPLRIAGLEDGLLHVATPDKFHRDFMDDNYGAWFAEFLPNVAPPACRVAFVVDDRPPARAPPPPAPSRLVPAGPDPRDLRPSSRYTFETFVVGESNQFAFAAAKAVADRPGQSYNPLFLHGDSGLGKTHLLHAVANAILASRPVGRVAVVSSERYTNEFVEGLRKGTLDEFRRKYRECSALLIDDVQFLAGKERTAEEFFHTFNDLHEQHVQIVLSSDRSPRELKGLEDRLCSRFEWGMRVQINAPEFETRSAIVQHKAEQEGIALPDDVAQLLATHIRSNVRELHGALMRVAAFASLKAEPITVRLARDVLADVIPPPGYKPSIERIQELVAAHYNLTVARLTSASREQKIALPRQVAMYLCRELARETFQLIAEKFNKRDHTTVISAKDRIEELLATDPEVQAAVSTLTQKLAP